MRRDQGAHRASPCTARIQAERAAWQALLAEIGEDRMEEPGPMGDWTFKDLAAHLTFWSEWTNTWIEAGPGGNPSRTWPASMGTEEEITDFSEVNAWIREQSRDRALRDVLADAGRSYERLATLIATMPEEDLMTPGRFEGMGDKALVDGDFFGHFHDEHEQSLRAWIQTH